MMKLCFVLPSVPHYRNELLNSLSSDKAIDELIVLGGYGASRKVIKNIQNPKGFHVYFQELKSISIGEISVKYQVGLIMKLLKERPTHIIILYHMSIFNHTLVPLLCKMIGIKIYFWGSGSGEDSSIRGENLRLLIKLKLQFKRQFYKLFDGILVYSQKHKNRLVNQNIRVPIQVAQNTCDVDSLFKLPISAKDDNNLLFIGALESVKRLDVLIKALASVETVNWTLDIIGSGSQMDFLRNLTDELNLNTSISFHGALYNDATMKFWNSASHVVLPGVGGLLINEAMAAGKYILATSGDGTGEDLLLEEDLLVHNVTDVELTEHIEGMFALDPKQYISKCQRNRDYAVNNLRIEHLQRDILSILKSKAGE